MSAHAVQALLVASLGWYLFTEGLHAGVAASRLARRGAAGPAPWRPLGPLVLVDEVWLVVVLALAAAGFPATDHRAWAVAGPSLLMALALSLALFALLMLGPVFRRAGRPLLALSALGCLVPFAWALALGDVAGAPWLVVAGSGVAAVAAALLLGVGFVELPMRAGAARWWRPVAGASMLALLIGCALALAPDGMLWPTGDPATLRLLAWSAVITLPGVLALQTITWRWTLARWLRGQVLVPIHAVGRPLPAPPPVEPVGRS